MTAYIAQSCEYCGQEVAPGDEVWETEEGFVHDDCFIGYMRDYAKALNWPHYVFGDEE